MLAHHMPWTPQKYQFLDALRGVAILGVVACHTALWIHPHSEFLRTVAFRGAHGVQLFFVVSAFTLMLSMSKRSQQERNHVRNYFIRRFFRIAPLFYLAILVSIAIYGIAPRYWAPNGLSIWAFPLTATFLHGWHPETITSVVPGGWSIAVEFTFYLCLPLLFRLITDVPRSILFITATLILHWQVSSTYVEHLKALYPTDQQYLATDFTYMWFFSQWPVFGLGILTYHLFREHEHKANRLAGFALFTTSLLLMYACLHLKTYRNIVPQHFMYGVAFVCFILSLHFYPTRLLVNRLSCQIGKLSFSIYLNHFLVLGLLQHNIKFDYEIGSYGYIAAVMTVLTISAALSYCTYQYIEQPGIAAGKWIIIRLEQSGDTSQPRSPGLAQAKSENAAQRAA